MWFYLNTALILFANHHTRNPEWNEALLCYDNDFSPYHTLLQQTSRKKYDDKRKILYFMIHERVRPIGTRDKWSIDWTPISLLKVIVWIHFLCRNSHRLPKNWTKREKRSSKEMKKFRNWKPKETIPGWVFNFLRWY